MPDTDGQLYLRFLTGNDEDSLRILYEKYNEGLTLFINGIVNNIEDSEDLMMETFAILASGTARYVERRNASFKTWLFAIGKKQALMLLRKRRFSLTPIEQEDVQNQESTEDYQPDYELLQNERNSMLYQALKEINSDYSQVLYLSFFEDMKPEQISRIMKISLKQTYNLTARGKTALKTVLERKGYSWNTSDT